MQVELEAAAEHVAAEKPLRVREIDGPAQSRDGLWVLGADVHIAFSGADRVTSDCHAFDEREWVTFDNHSVGKRARVAFVEVAAHEFLRRRLAGDGLPLDSGGESGAAPTAQAGCDDFVDHL